MNKVRVNGITITGNHKSIVINDGKIYVDGSLYEDEQTTPEMIFNGPIIVNGNVNDVDGTDITINGDVTGDVDGTNITVKGDVEGDIDGVNVVVKGRQKI